MILRTVSLTVSWSTEQLVINKTIIWLSLKSQLEGGGVEEGAVDQPTFSEMDWMVNHWTIGWVNLYKKFEIEKYTLYIQYVVNSFYPKKWKGI